MKFRLKTILGIASIESILLLVLVISGLNFLSHSNEKQLLQRAETTSRLLASTTKDAVLATDLATLESLIEEILTNPDVVYARISSNDVILAEGGDKTILSRQHLPDHRLDEIDDGIFDIRTEISEGGAVYGVIEIGFSTTAIEQLLAEAMHWTVSIASLEVILVAIFSFILGTYLTRQLQRLKSASDIIARSGPGHQVKVHGDDEIAEVARAFNAMSTSLQETYSELRRSIASHERVAAIAKRNQAKNEAILSASLDAMITIDQQGEVLDFNEAAVGIFGWSHDEIVGQSMVDFIVPPEMREAHERGMEHYLATGEGPVLDKRLELTAQHKDGHQFPIEIAISPLETDQGAMFTAFIRDISERLKAEIELRLAAQAFESSEAMFISDANGNITRINTAFTRTTGYEASEVLGKNPRLLSSGRYGKEFYQEMWRQLLESGSWSGEIYNMRKDGEIFPEHLNISAVKNTEGETTHYVAHFVDITEQKQNEERLSRAQRQAEAASEAKSLFLAAMSHEIRTPMGGVLGILELLRDTPLNGQQQRLVQTARESGELLLNIINDILDYSKMDAEKLQLEHTGFDLERLLVHAVDLLKNQAEAKGLTLELTQETELPRYAKGDPSRLRQILLNLIGNAIKFTNNGSISVEVSTVQVGGNRFTLHCAVEDTGIGIPRAAQAQLFDEFTMADQSHSRVHGGTGLGLAICKRLVSLMGGRIDFNSETGKGSTFFFSVELETTDAAEVAADPVTSTSAPRPAADIYLLLAEDNLANRLVIKSILESAGLRVDMVADGREAVDAVCARSYDIVLMDISMPEMDGMAATQEIRKLPGGAGSVPIVALTAHALPGDRERFLAAGMSDYLTKPVDRDAVLHCIARWTGARGSQEPEDSAIETAAPNSSAGSREPYVDGEVLQQMARDKGPEIVFELLKRYVDDARKRVEAIQIAVSASDVKRLAFESRTLGSSAAAHGNPKLHTLARRIENLCQSGEHDQALAKAVSLPEIATESLRLLEVRGKVLSTNPSTAQPATADEPTSQPSKVLDTNTLKQLARDTSPQALPRLLAAFREETNRRVRAVTRHLSPPAVEQLKQEAHSLKSSAGTFGAFELQKLALELELACRNGELGDVEEKVRGIEEAWRQVSMQLDRYLADDATASTAPS